MLKKILIVIAALIILPLSIALSLDNEYEVERSVIIQRSAESVFSYIRQLKNQNHYSTWAQLDPSTEYSYKGTDGTVGFIVKWESQNPEVGVGEQEIKVIKPNEKIEFELRFLKPFQATEPAYMVTQSLGNNQTKVIWGFEGHVDYPANLTFLVVDFEQQIGNDLQQGLNNLKVILEKPNNGVKYL